MARLREVNKTSEVAAKMRLQELRDPR